MLDDFTSGQLCHVVVMGTAQDQAGGADRDPYTIVHASVPVTVREQGGSRDPRNGKATQTNIGRLYFTADYGITTRHQVVLLDAAGRPARWLVVVSGSDVMNMGRLWQVDFEEVAA